MPPGSYNTAVIILLTDGQRTTGPDTIAAARLAADRGVRIYTVGVGTPDGKIIGFEGWSMHVRLDEETLKTIADLTRGEYFYAGNALDLKKVYETLRTPAGDGDARRPRSRRCSPPPRRCSPPSPGCCRCSGSIASSRKRGQDPFPLLRAARGKGS